MNQTFLAKIGWTFVIDQKCFHSMFMKAKYYPSSDFFRASRRSSPSFIWDSIVWGRDLLSKDLDWSIGNGNQVRIGVDNWITSNFFYKPFACRESEFSHLKVVDMLHFVIGTWDVFKLNAFF